MENRKLIKFLILIPLLAFVNANSVFAYGIDTHAFLTSETIEFYNRHFSESKIPNELRVYLLDGSRREDDVPRWMNHFYDPVYDRGLTYDPAIDSLNLGTWQKSKEWAQDDKNQNNLTYKVPATIASILTAVQQGKISAISAETNFTWQKAISYWVSGDKEKAMFTLGHILHLMQDASVPDHTRNDPHPEGSPYENWTARFTIDNPDKNLTGKLYGRKPLVLENLDSYFNELAAYSNNDFYSKDTIGIQSGYKSPEPDYFGKDGFYAYGFKNDLVSGDYHLLAYKNPPNSYGWVLNNKENLIFEERVGPLKILPDYWSRLSVKAAQYGVGVINFFFKEAEKAKSELDAAKEEPKSFFARAVDTAGDFFKKLLGGKDKDDLALVAEIPLGNSDNQSGEVRPPEINRQSGEVEPLRIEPLKRVDETSESDEEIIENAPAVVASEQRPLKVCSFNVSQSPSRQKLVINEVAWMGTLASANDEWIELKNISSNELDVSGWQLLDQGEQIKITFGNIKLPAGGLLLLERTDDNSVPGVTADLIYTGALSNTDEGLRLFDNECNLIDEAAANPNWPAGDNGTKRTMERSSDLTWHTYTGDPSTSSGQVAVFGTPKKENSPKIIVGAAGAGSGSSANLLLSQEGPAPSVHSEQVKILISEIQISGNVSNDEFVELYNPNSEPVDLTGWAVKRKSSSGAEYSLVSATRLEGKTIPAKGYFLMAHETDYASAVTPDVLWAKSNSIASNNTALIYDDGGNVIDKVGFGSASDFETSPYPDNPDAGKSLSRTSEIDTDNNAADFSLTNPTPKNSSTYGGFLALAEPEPELEQEQEPASAAEHLVISEIFIDMEGADSEEFVELYNPTEQAVALADWSLQYLSGSATSTDKIVKKNFSSNAAIGPKGFYLIGTGGYSGEMAADMTWSQSLNNTAATVFLVASTSLIASADDASIIDRIAYGEGEGILLSEGSPAALPEAGQSLERKAFSGDSCVSSRGDGEFLGNSCDTDDNAADFEVRVAPNPQNSQSLPEPREAPSVVQNFTAQYDPATLIVTLNWDESQDYSGATSTIKYVLNYGTSSPETLKSLAELAATTTYKFRINEVGIDYYFSISAKDKDGFSSASASAVLNVSSPLDNLYFYKDTRSPSAGSGQATTSKKYLLELYYDSYPFVPDIYNRGGWRILVFYLNKEAPAEIELNTANNFQPEDLKNVLDIKYDACGGATRFSLILPNIGFQCVFGGGVDVRSLKSSNLEDLHLLLELATTTDGVIFTAQDFVTVGMYSFYDSGGGSQRFRLSGLDRNKYYFQTETPEHQPPQFDGELELDFNKQKSWLVTGWQRAADSDTLDSLITYEINYSTSTQLEAWSWQSVGAASETHKQVSPGNAFLIGVRAKDDFGNYSEIKTAEWAYPETTFSIIQAETNNWSWAFGTKNPNCSGCPDTAGFQSIEPEEDFEFNTVVLRLRQELVSDSADLRLSVYPDDDGLPDFDELIAKAELKNIINPDPNLDIAFVFNEPVSVEAGDIYWLVLDVKNYSDNRGWYRNRWQNAINVGEDLYEEGEAGRGNADNCSGSYCANTYIPYPDGTADWYFKIGLTP